MNKFWNNRATLITGASGLLGGWLVKRLISHGANVVCLVRDSVPKTEFQLTGLDKKVTLIKGDLSDRALLERIISEYEIDTVLHLAAQAIVGAANRNPIGTFEANIAGTWNLLESCRNTNCVKQIIVASSDKAYGDHEILPYNEKMALQGRHPYDVSKSCADLISHCYAHTYELPVVITRCGNFFGGGDLNWSRIIPGTIRSLLNGDQPVIRSDGNYIRDYLYVEDGAAAYMLLAEKLAMDRSLIGQAFNFSNESQISVIDIVTMICKKMKVDLYPIIKNEASNEIRQQFLSAEKARIVLNWEPKFELELALDRTIEWYRNYLKLNNYK
jgi:CDP-glucose 4,6-dehydratase